MRVDGRLLLFISKKSGSLFANRTNPRRVSWTVLYRRVHKKDQAEEVAKRRARKTARAPRPIDGNSLQSIMERRNQPSEVRRQQREAAVQAAKDKAREKRQKKAAVPQDSHIRQQQKNVKAQTKDRTKQPRAPKMRVQGKR